MDFLYQEILMDHYRNPHNRGTLTDKNFASGQYNPSCGDLIQLQGIISDNVLTKLVFEGKGCVISLATASLLTQSSTGKTIEELMLLDRVFIQKLIGIELGLTRLKCALLPLMALQEGLEKYTNIHKKEGQ